MELWAALLQWNTGGNRRLKRTKADVRNITFPCNKQQFKLHEKSPRDHYSDDRIATHTEHPLSTAGSGLTDIQSQWALVWHGSPDSDQNIPSELLSLWCPFTTNFVKTLCSGLSRNGKATSSSLGLTDTCGVCMTKRFYTDSEDR